MLSDHPINGYFPSFCFITVGNVTTVPSIYGESTEEQILLQKIKEAYLAEINKDYKIDWNNAELVSDLLPNTLKLTHDQKIKLLETAEINERLLMIYDAVNTSKLYKQIDMKIEADVRKSVEESALELVCQNITEQQIIELEEILQMQKDIMRMHNGFRSGNGVCGINLTKGIFTNTNARKQVVAYHIPNPAPSIQTVGNGAIRHSKYAQKAINNTLWQNNRPKRN